VRLRHKGLRTTSVLLLGGTRILVDTPATRSEIALHIVQIDVACPCLVRLWP
jgi:hypothetical protein